jgi:hypothetical protein
MTNPDTVTQRYGRLAKRVGAENTDTSRSLHIFVEKAAEPQGRAAGGRVLIE